MTTGPSDHDEAMWSSFRRALGDVQWKKSTRASGPSDSIYSGSLRKFLPDLAIECCTQADRPEKTPKQLAAEIARIINCCNSLCTLLTRVRIEDPPYSRLQYLVSPMSEELQAFVTELERLRDEQPATDNQGNRRTAHNIFWEELARIFDDHVGKDVKFRNQHLIRFLYACSEPFFSEVRDDRSISAFVERRSARSTSST